MRGYEPRWQALQELKGGPAERVDGRSTDPGELWKSPESDLLCSPVLSGEPWLCPSSPVGSHRLPTTGLLGLWKSTCCAKLAAVTGRPKPHPVSGSASRGKEPLGSFAPDLGALTHGRARSVAEPIRSGPGSDGKCRTPEKTIRQPCDAPRAKAAGDHFRSAAPAGSPYAP